MKTILPEYTDACAVRMEAWITSRCGEPAGRLFSKRLDRLIEASGDRPAADRLGEAIVDAVRGKASAEDFRDRFRMEWKIARTADHCAKMARDR